MADQRTDEWWAARRGKVTASRIKDVMAKLKNGKAGKTRNDYMLDLMSERGTGTTASSYVNAAMQWGIDTEAQARAAYEIETGVEIEEVGFMVHPTIAMSGASPDGLIRAQNMVVEIKCPNTTTHLNTILSGTGAMQYYKQIQWQMVCAGEEYRKAIFISYDPRVLEGIQEIWSQPVDRDDDFIAEMEEEVVAFLKELDENMNTVKKGDAL